MHRINTNATARLTVDYYGKDGVSLGNQVVAFGSRPLTDPVFSFVLQKPDDAYTMGLTLVMRDVQFLNNVSVTFVVESIDMAVSYDSLVYMQQQTGRTNKILQNIQQTFDDFLNRNPDPVEPTWGESAGDAEAKEDQIIDQLDPDKVTNDLADMHLTLVDNLLLYTNAFAAISAIWVVLIDLPFIKIILYCSLLFGLLAAFLGMGLAAGRASDRHSGRSSGKKGK